MTLTGNLQIDLPELAHNTLLQLFDRGIVTTQQLVGKFLSMRYVDDTTSTHCERFMEWLHFAPANDRFLLLDLAGSCADKCFPSSYDPSVGAT